MNTHVAYALYSLHHQVAGPRYIEHHFGWWALACLVLMFVLMKCAGVVRSLIKPSTGKGIKKFSQQLGGMFSGALVGILSWAAVLAGIAAICLFVMWAIALRHHPGNM
ncbi:MAG TPA: hypothetical protein VN031_04220 [Candidatus Microsaccharimonas sp.]|nr:hypothetical protein [Candidatus Microsaccharimonas sp.]